jgi:hypothetical protein
MHSAMQLVAIYAYVRHRDSRHRLPYPVSIRSTQLAFHPTVIEPLRLKRGSTDRLTFSIGIGPYLAYDGIDDRKWEIVGIGSIRVTLRLFGRYEAGLMYTRVASFYNRDQDIVMIGILGHL